MSIDSTQLGALHLLAQRFGEGLKPELADLLLRRVPQDVARLNCPLKSSGPAEHSLTPEDLKEMDIPQIGTMEQADTRKEGTHD